MRTTMPLVVAYDGSHDAKLALRWVAEESLRTGAPVRVLAVNELLAPTWGGVGGTIVVTETYVRDCSELLGEAEKELADLGVTDVTTQARSGNVVDEMLHAADHASVLVVGSRGHSAAGEALMGSVSQHLARHANCPVVVVREPRDATSRRIVVGIDGSVTSMAALDFAVRRAEETGETVVAIHGWRDHVASADVYSSEPRMIELQQHELLLAESLAGMRTEHPDVRIEHEAISVPPEKCLVDASAHASLVVVGSRGQGYFRGLLLGSVSQAVLHRAQCPVAVVR
ncbi:UspA domain-containing protein [Nocardioides sp. S5]|uniref:universal stress protein n=1 Tax=Nocardioides sp. S5 TaxID=2017486 RepID=UPI001A8F4021|nr:universal stress protein [Nocardioides sp. S5]QSR30730.1 UspA domain-containing protein [Nocardioides sp. S5]